MYDVLPQNYDVLALTIRSNVCYLEETIRYLTI